MRMNHYINIATIAIAVVAMVVYALHVWASQPCTEMIFDPENQVLTTVDCGV